MVKLLNLELKTTTKYYDLYDLFNNLVDYTKNENDERTVENFLKHHKTKKVFNHIYNSEYNEHIIEGETTVVGDDLAVCCALVFIDADKYINSLVCTTNIEINTELFNIYNDDTLEYNLMYRFASEDEEDAWKEHTDIKINIENVDVDDVFDDEYINNWIENYRKEKKNER